MVDLSRGYTRLAVRKKGLVHHLLRPWRGGDIRMGKVHLDWHGQE